MTFLRIIDNLTGYREIENFDTTINFDYEIQHSPLKIGNSIKKLLQTVKDKQIKFVKISSTSVLNKDINDKTKSEARTTTRHFFDFLMSNMIYDIIKNCNNTILTNWFIKNYMVAICDLIDNFEKYPYDNDDFNRMNYGIFVNDSKEYGGNCQIFSMIYGLINTCKQHNKANEFIKMCSDSRFKKYYVYLFNNFEELLMNHSQKINLMFWLVSIDIMMKLNKINENAYVITMDLLNSGFIINSYGVKIQKDIRKEVEEQPNSIIYVCDKHCHVGFNTSDLIFDIDNMNFPADKNKFIDRACEYYNFNSSNINFHYYLDSFVV